MGANNRVASIYKKNTQPSTKGEQEKEDVCTAASKDDDGSPKVVVTDNAGAKQNTRAASCLLRNAGAAWATALLGEDAPKTKVETDSGFGGCIEETAASFK